MKDKLNRFMQGRYGVDNFARFTLGVALFVIVVGSFMRQNAAGGVLDTVGSVSYTHLPFPGQNQCKAYVYRRRMVRGISGINAPCGIFWRTILCR